MSAATVQRVLAATSSFFEWAIAAEQYTAGENPMQRRVDHALGRVPDRHQPFVGAASRQQPVRRTVRVRLPLRLPRPITNADVNALLASITTMRDLAIVLLMLDGGLRPGEVLCLQLADVSYGRRRVTIRKRDDHPRGARAKARHERVVDLHESRTLDAVNRHVLHERPLDAESPFLFLVGGSGARRSEPLSYQAVARGFARRFIPDHELTALMTAVDHLANPYQRAALIVACWSGARRDEIRRLAVDCLDTYPDGHPRLRIPVGKGYTERSIPLHPQAADALHPLIDTARQQRGRRRYDPSAGREVQHIFVVRGKLLSKSLLFDMALDEACTAAGLVDSAGKATITAHRFRHMIGTQLAEGGARIQTIMAVLGHRTPNMSIIYASLSDPTVKQQYQDALDRRLGPEVTLAGPAADALREHRLDPEAVSWLQTNFLKTELELGHCLRSPAEGPCECDLVLTCSKFLTTSDYAPRLHARLAVEQQLIDDAAARGWQREIERHSATKTRHREPAPRSRVSNSPWVRELACPDVAPESDNVTVTAPEEPALTVTFAGCGDAFGSGGRYQACIHLRGAGGSGPVLLDCGATSLSALKRLGLDPGEIAAVFVSHLHGDHFGGLPFLILDGQFSRRTEPLIVAGPPGIARRLADAMECMFPGSSTAPRRFGIDTVELNPGLPAPCPG